MSEQPNVDNGQGAAPGSAPDQNANQGQPPSGDQGQPNNPNNANDTGGETPRGGDQGQQPGGQESIMIPKHRFDDLNKTWEEKYNKLETQYGDLSGKFQGMAQALQGQSPEVKNSKVRELADKYNIQEDFVQDMLSTAEEMATQKFEAELRPLKQKQAKNDFESEMNELYNEFPEAKSMSKDEMAQLQQKAYDPAFSRVPISDIYKMLNFGRPQGNPNSAETGQAGAGRTGVNRGESPDIGSMSLEEFEAYSNKLAAQS